MRRSRCSSSFGHPPLRSRRVRPRRVRHVSATLSKTSVIASCTHRSGSFSSRSEIETVDDDLGRSAAGGVARAGFERMVADICLGKVGAVAAREVSRFARNSRDWQQLIEICRVVDTVLIDQETVYAPRQGNDRLLLGLKRSLNEYRSMPRATLAATDRVRMSGEIKPLPRLRARALGNCNHDQPTPGGSSRPGGAGALGGRSHRRPW